MAVTPLDAPQPKTHCPADSRSLKDYIVPPVVIPIVVVLAVALVAALRGPAF